MKYTSTSKASTVDLYEAVNHCVAPDGSMYMPQYIPTIPKAFFNNIGEMNLQEIAYVVATSFFGQDIDSAILKKIAYEAFAVDAPLHRVNDNTYILELFHGPTLTFKDYGARFMARIMQALDRKNARARNVLVATTGNTGAAAAHGLFKLDGFSVTVLYPKGRLTGTQRAQITALGENIHPVEIAGTVEDCKNLVNKAIVDSTLESFNLTGANSINIARLIPQITFALYAYAHLKALGVAGAENAVYSIPSGNLSNVVATAMAKMMGMPCGLIVGATAANNQLAPLMKCQQPASGNPVRTFAPSIDMVYPSGWERLKSLYDGDYDAMSKDIAAPDGIDNQTIADTINHLRRDFGYTIDPHGAVAYAALQNIYRGNAPAVVFATGHPAKQLDTMTKITGCALDMPVQLAKFMGIKRQPAIIPPTLPALKKHLSSIH